MTGTNDHPYGLGKVCTFSAKQHRFPRARSSKPMESEYVYCNCFWTKSKTTQAWQIFQGKVNSWNEMWTCKWKVSDNIVKDVIKLWLKGYRQNG